MRMPSILRKVGAVVDAKTGKTTALPAATEVVPGWYIGGKYSDERKLLLLCYDVKSWLLLLSLKQQTC